MTQTLPFGSWPSPISAQDVAAGSHPVDAGRYIGDEIWWLERMPAERGRSAVRRATASGTAASTVLPAPWDVRSRVHEYGGGAWTVAPDGALSFAESSDQRVWTLEPGSEEPRALTPAEQNMRFADLVVWGERILAVRETHDDPRTPHRDIVAIPRDGSAAEDPAAITTLVSGSHFFAYPRVSPDGLRLAWVAWNHPQMPWDGTTLNVGDIVDLTVSGARAIAGGPTTSVLQPEWTSARELTYASDESGRWNLYRLDVTTATPASPLAPVDADTGSPLWNLGVRWYAPLADGRIVAVQTNGDDQIVVIDREGTVRELPTDVTSGVLLGHTNGTRVLLTGSGASTLGGLWELDVDDVTGSANLVRGTVDDAPDAAWLPLAESVAFDGPHGEVHAFAYPPTNPRVAGAKDELPPYLVLAHGGPTAHRSGGASIDIAFWTSRGIGVLDVNYGGSSGYGRAYRERLRGQWGIVDRDDVIAAASGLAATGFADGTRLAIRGGSAGGWTVLCALTASDRFAAGISRYGVADLRALAQDTHDFEARYLDGLVGPYPDAEAIYLDRSPLSHLDRFRTPMLLEQGLDDPVVPPMQSEAVRDALASRGVPHAYVSFEGESHGFRRAETIIASLEAELSFLGQILGFDPPGVPPLPLS